MEYPILKFSLLDADAINFYYWDSTTNSAQLTDVDQYIEAPTTWKKSIKPRWVRDTAYWGVFRSMNPTLDFVGDGANILRYLMATMQEVQTEVVLRIYRLNTTTLHYDTLYESFIDFKGAKDSWQGTPHDFAFKVPLIDSKLFEILKAYESTEYQIAFGHYNGGTYVNDNIWVDEPGISLYALWNFATSVDPTIPSGQSYDLTSGDINSSLVALNEVVAPNKPIGNDLSQNIIKTGVQVPISAGTDMNKPWGRVGGDGAYTSSNFFFKLIPPFQAAGYYASIYTQIRIDCPKFAYDGTTFEDFQFNIYEVDKTNQITIGNTNKTKLTGRITVFTIRYWGGGGGGAIQTLCDGGDGFAAVTIGKDATFTRNYAGNKYYELIYPNAGSTGDTLGAVLSLNPQKVYVLSVACVNNSGNFSVIGSGQCDIVVGRTALGFNFSLRPTTGSAFSYPPSPTPAMRLKDLGNILVPIMANSLGNVGFPQVSLANQNIPYTFASDFLSNASASWDDNWNCKPYNVVLTSGSGLRLNLSYTKVVDLSSIPSSGFNYEEQIETDDGAGGTITLPVVGPNFYDYAPYASIQGPFFKTSLKEFFDSCNAIFCMGGAIEPDVNGNDTVFRMEQLKYFFDDTLFICDLGNVVGLTLEPMIDIMGTSLKVGYQQESYNQDFGTDEYNLNLTYKLLTARIIKSLEWLCAYRADRYGEEFVRANSVANAQTQFNADNEKFLMSIDDTPTSKTYPDGTTLPTVYNKKSWIGTQNYKNGLFYPGTTEVNLELSPKRNMMRHGALLSAMSYKQIGDLLFQNYGINIKMGLQIQLDNSYPMLNEWGDVKLSDLPDPLFIPRIVKFRCSPPINLYQIMNQRDATSGKMLRYGYFTFTWRGLQYKGYTWEAGINVGDNDLYDFQLIPVYGQTNDITLANIGM